MAGTIDEYVERELASSLACLQDVYADAAYRRAIAEAATILADTIERGNKILIAGNGGSAADSQHIAGELVSRLNFDRGALPAIALTVDTSTLTAIGNDYGFNLVFARQIEGLGRPGDAFMPISTSGNSGNILAAIESAKRGDLTVIGMTGRDGGRMKAMCDLSLCVPSDRTPRIQEGHLATYHLLCGLIEERIFGDGFAAG